MATDVSLQQRVREVVAERVPGVAVQVVGLDGLHASAGVGSADLAADRPMTPDSVCPWFSMTKIVTATAAMGLVEEGVLDLDAPVAPHVPQMHHLRPADAAATITARHLLSHSAGLSNPIPVTWIHPADQPPPDPDAFLDGLLAKHRKLRFAPGTRSSYSNLGTLTLGAAMANVAGRAFTEIVATRVLPRLGTSRTGFTYPAPDEASDATGYHPRRSPMRLLLPRWVLGPTSGRWVSFNRFLLDGQAYGGLVGPVADAARFVRMHLQDGEIDGVRILNETSAREMREIRWQGRRFDLGLGWFRPAAQRDADPTLVHHLRGGAGFRNVIRIYPSRGLGIAVMGNATKYDIDAVARLALGAD